MTMEEEENGLPELPRGWVWTTIGKVTQPIEKVKPKGNPDIQFTYLDISSIDNQLNKVVEPKIYYGSEAPSRARQLVRAHDVLFSTVRTYLKNIALVPEIYDGQIASTGFSVLRGESAISPRYLFYHSLTDQFINPLSELQRGTSYPAVRDSDVRAQLIPLPPLPEQHRIVAKIEELFTQLDAGVAALEKAKAQLRRYRQAVLKAAVEGELTREWREAHREELEPASVLLERILEERRVRWETNHPGKQYKPPVPPDTEGLSELPEQWVWAAVEQIGNVRLGRQRSPKYHQGPNMRPYLRAANATWNGVDLSDVKEMDFPSEIWGTYRLQKDDILLAEASGSSNEVGKPFVWQEEIPECGFQNTLIRVQLFNLPPGFIHVHFLTDALTGRFGQVARGVNIQHLGATRLARFAIALPPLAEQRYIVDEVERRLSVADEMEKAVEQSLKRAERLRQSILKRAFEGRLVTQDPSDEPASLLLERIREKIP